ERGDVVRARVVLLQAEAVASGVRRVEQLVHVRPLRSCGAAVRPARPGPPEGAQLCAEGGAQALPRTTTSFEPLSVDGRSPSTGATMRTSASRASRRASLIQPGT